MADGAITTFTDLNFIRMASTLKCINSFSLAVAGLAASQMMASPVVITSAQTYAYVGAANLATPSGATFFTQTSSNSLALPLDKLTENGYLSKWAVDPVAHGAGYVRAVATIDSPSPAVAVASGTSSRRPTPGKELSYSRLPLSFEPAGKAAHFTAAGQGYRLSLLPGEVFLDLSAPSNSSGQLPPFRNRAVGRSGAKNEPGLRLRMIGADPKAQVTGLDPLPSRSFYLEGKDPSNWRTNVPSYSRVQYTGIYSGVDLVFYGNQSQLEYDLMVAPGASLNQVRFEVSGADQVRLDENGDLILATSSGQVLLQKPLIYQQDGATRKPIAGNFKLKGNRIGFSVGVYDATLPLVVDPVLDYATYLGRASNDHVNAIAVGRDGSSYLAGVTPRSAASGQDEAFIARVSADGKTLLFMTFLGGSGATDARGIALDAAGNIFVTGATSAIDFPVLNAFQPSCGLTADQQCSGDAYLARLNPDGSLNFATYLGGSGVDEANAIAVDSAGDVYIAGSTGSGQFPVVRAIQTTTGGLKDAFVAKISGDGSQVAYATYLGGSADDEALGLAVGEDRSVYVTGWTKSSDFPVKQAYQQLCHLDGSNLCRSEAFVAKLAPDGSELVYSTYLGGSGEDVGSAIAVDAKDQAYVTGVTASTDFPSSHALQPSAHGKNDGFVTKFSADGLSLAWSTYLGGAGDDLATSIALDYDGNAYISGYTDSSDFPIQSPVQAECRQGANGACNRDAFAAVLNSGGSALRFSTYLGGAGVDQGFGIALDKQNNIYVGGATSSSDFPLARSIDSSRAAIASPGRTGSHVQMTVARPEVSGEVTRESAGILAKISRLGTAPACATGTTTNWTGAVSNQWNVAGNWDANAIPGVSDVICVNSSTNTPINVPSLPTANQTVTGLLSNEEIDFSSGPLTIKGSATFANVTLNGGTLTINGSATFVNVTLNGGTLTLNGTTGSSVTGSLTIGPAIFAGADSVTVTGLLTLNNSAQMCTLSNCGVPALGTLSTITANGGIGGGAGTIYLYGRNLTNSGTSSQNWTLFVAYGSTVNNPMGSIWNDTCDCSIANQGGTTPVFNNSGAFSKTGGATTRTNVSATFNNTSPGSVSIGQNLPELDFYLVGPAASTGSWSVAAGSILGLSAGSSNTVAISGTISGAGTVDFGFNGGTLNVTGVSAGAYNVTGGTRTTGGAGVASFNGTTTNTGTIGSASGYLNFNTSIGGQPLTVSTAGGFVGFSTGSAIGVTSLTMNGGTLYGTDTVNVSGTTTWSNNATMCTTLSSGSCVAPAGVQAIVNANGGITGQNSASLYGRTLNNNGAAAFTGAAVGSSTLTMAWGPSSTIPSARRGTLLLTIPSPTPVVA